MQQLLRGYLDAALKPRDGSENHSHTGVHVGGLWGDFPGGGGTLGHSYGSDDDDDEGCHDNEWEPQYQPAGAFTRREDSKCLKPTFCLYDSKPALLLDMLPPLEDLEGVGVCGGGGCLEHSV
jgi:hypothetical protein